MTFLRYGVLLFSLMSSFAAIAQADQCKDILVDGVRDRIATIDVYDMGSATKQWFCSDEFESFASSHGSSTSITVPVNGSAAEFGGNASDSNAKQLRDQFCSDKVAQFSESDATTIFRQIASPVVIDAWRECMKALYGGTGQMVQFEAKRIDPQSFVLVASWKPSYSGQPSPIIEYVVTRGVECSDARLKPGMELTVQPVREICTQSEQVSAYILLATSFGDFETRLARDLTGTPAGDIRLLYGVNRSYWISGPIRSERKTTGDHHCSRNCDGEPTRTNYQIVLTAGSDALSSPPA